jgi:hypothetical protein
VPLAEVEGVIRDQNHPQGGIMAVAVVTQAANVLPPCTRQERELHIEEGQSSKRLTKLDRILQVPHRHAIQIFPIMTIFLPFVWRGIVFQEPDFLNNLE